MRISLLTPVAARSLPWLAEAEESVRAARMELDASGDADLEWVVCVDGPFELELESADRMVRWSRPAGVSAARNAALAAATGDWVVPLDADDLLEPHGLVAAVTAIRRLQDEGPVGTSWIGLNRLLVDGARTAHWFSAEQYVEEGELAAGWRAPFRFHPNTLVILTALCRRVSGWPALRVNEDLALALLLGEHAPGLLLPEPLIRYRSWEGQTVNEPGYVEDKRTAFHMIETMVNAVRLNRGRSLVVAPQAGGAFGRTAIGGMSS